jgi:hypothetical protein
LTQNHIGSTVKNSVFPTPIFVLKFFSRILQFSLVFHPKAPGLFF